MIEIKKMKDSLQEILEFQKGRSEEHLGGILNNLDPQVFDEIVNLELDKVTVIEAKEYGLKNFDKLDRYPNPKDGFISKDELAERISITKDSHERAVLLWIWLAFDQIRQLNDDFHGQEKAFDNVLSLKDFQNMTV